MNAFFYKLKEMRGVFFNSLVCFLIAYFIIKAFIGLFTYLAIKFNGGTASIEGLHVINNEPYYDDFWKDPQSRYQRVFWIFGTGVVVSALLYFIVVFFRKRHYKKRGLFKVFLIWMSILSLFHCLGYIFTGAVLKEHFYYVLQWMHLPYFVIIIIGILALVFFFIIINRKFYRYVSISPSISLIDNMMDKKLFFVINYILVAAVGYIIIFLILLPDLGLRYLIELPVLLLTFALALHRDKEHPVSVVKGDTTGKFQIFPILFLGVLITSYFLVYGYYQ